MEIPNNVIDLGKAIAESLSKGLRDKPDVVQPSGALVPTLLIPSGYTRQDLKLSELDVPKYVSQKVDTRRVADFIAYVNRFKNEQSVIFVSPTLALDGSALLTAVIDYHSAQSVPSTYVTPRWGSHVVTYTPMVSPAYAALLDLTNGLVDQDKFIDKVRRLSRFITSMSEAAMLELLRTFKVATNGNFKNYEDPISGSVDFRFEIQVVGSAGTTEKKISIPTHFDFNIPILYDGAATAMQAEFAYREPKKEGGENKVRMGLELVNRQWEELAAVDNLAVAAATGTQLMTLIGSPANSYPIKH